MLPNMHLQRDYLGNIIIIILGACIIITEMQCLEYRFHSTQIKHFNIVHREMQVMLLNHVLPNNSFCMKG